MARKGALHIAHTHKSSLSLPFPEPLAHLLPSSPSCQAAITHFTRISFPLSLSTHSFIMPCVILCVPLSPFTTSVEKDKRELQKERYSSCYHKRARDWQRIRAVSTNKRGPKASAGGMPKLFYHEDL